MTKPLRLPMRPSPESLLARVENAYTPETRAFLAALPERPRKRLMVETMIAAGHYPDAAHVERMVIVENDEDGDVRVASRWAA